MTIFHHLDDALHSHAQMQAGNLHEGNTNKQEESEREWINPDKRRTLINKDTWFEYEKSDLFYVL